MLSTWVVLRFDFPMVSIAQTLAICRSSRFDIAQLHAICRSSPFNGRGYAYVLSDGIQQFRTSPHKTSRTGFRPTRRSARPPATRSASGKTEPREPPLTPAARSTTPLASPAACACPSPCADSTNDPCESHNLFPFRNPDLHHRLLGHFSSDSQIRITDLSCQFRASPS